MNNDGRLLPFKIDFDSAVPIYLQLMDSIRFAVARRSLPPGERVPSVRETAAELHLSPTTVQRAYQELEREGILVTRRGQGTFINDEPEIMASIRNQLARNRTARFLEEMAGLGFSLEDIIQLLKQASDTAGAANPDLGAGAAPGLGPGPNRAPGPSPGPGYDPGPGHGAGPGHGHDPGLGAGPGPSPDPNLGDL